MFTFATRLNELVDKSGCFAGINFKKVSSKKVK